MALLVGLLGGECTGKSTLAAALAAQVDATVAPEAVRDFVRHHGRAPGKQEQDAVLALQAQAVTEAAASAGPRGVVVADPAPLMTAVYSVLYFDDDTLLPAGTADALGYDVLVWCAPDLPWEADPGMRDGPAYRTAAERILADVVETTLRPRGAEVVRVTGGVHDRVAAACRALASRPSRAGVAPPGPSDRNLDSHG